MEKYDVVVIGGGAAGIVAAISARQKGRSVLIAERMPRLGKKILATGSGRCNFLAEKLDSSFYNKEARETTESVFRRFGRDDMLRFFRELGLAYYSEEGRFFPVTDQSSSVLGVLEMELRRLQILSECHCEIAGIEFRPEGFRLISKSGKSIACSHAILCGGGKSYPALGSDGNAFALAQKLGHRIIEPVPSTVPLIVKDPWCHALQGQRIQAVVTALAGGRKTGSAPGELLFTKYGLSGTAILDVSEAISIAIHRDHVPDVSVSVDLVPFLGRGELREELSRRLAKGIRAEGLILGLLPQKFSMPLSQLLLEGNVERIVERLKNQEFRIDGTRGWNEAEFTAGGVDLAEVDCETLESKIRKGLYLAGEILNVQGARGGYNLAWAWASGYVAGMNA